ALRAFHAEAPPVCTPSPKRPRRFTPPGPKNATRTCVPCCISPPASSASRPACGPSRWWPKSATRRTGLPVCSVARASAWSSNAWASAGSEPSTGSSAPTRSTREKKTPRLADRTGRVPPGLGAGLPGRDVVDPSGATRTVRLGRGRAPAAAAQRARRREGGLGLLRAVAGRHWHDAAAVRRGAAGQPGDRGLPGLAVPAVRAGGQEGVRAGLGQRLLARQQAGKALDRGAQPEGEA